jgi:putative ABC transport system permease protein
MRNFMLASRNLLRHKRKTLVVLSALIVGLAGLVVFQGFLSEMMRIWRDSSILSGVGHLQVAGESGYFEDGEFNPYAYPFPEAAQVAARLLKEPGVEAVFPSTGFVAMAGFGEESKTLLVKAYPAERSFFAPKMGATKTPPDRFLLGTLESGDPIRAGERDRLLLGATSARVLGVRAGDTVTLMAILPGGQLTGRDFAVSGIFSVIPGQDDLYAYTDYDTAADFTGLSGPPVLDVLLDGVDRVDAVAASLPPNVSFRTWKDLAQLYVQVNSILASFLAVIRTVILLVTLFILANTMNRVVVERMREWGTLRAMGAKKRDILYIVLCEGCLMGAGGAILGILLGFGIATAINLSGGLSFMQGPFAWVIFDRPGPDSVVLNVVPATLVAGLAAILPGRKAIRLSPSECLREV